MNTWFYIPEQCQCNGIATLRIVPRNYFGTDVDMLSYICQKCGAASTPNNTESGAANAWHRGDVFEKASWDLLHSATKA